MNSEIKKAEMGPLPKPLEEVFASAKAREKMVQTPARRELINHEELFNLILAKLDPISFTKFTELEEAEKLKKQHFIIETVDEVLRKANESNWTMSMKFGKIFAFNGAYWKTVDKQMIENFLGKAAEILGIDKYEAKFYSFKSELFKQLMSSAFFVKPVISNDDVLINLLNGTFVINPTSTGLKKFEPGDFLRYQLEFEYDQTATCPKFMKFLDEVLPDKEMQAILSEYVSYTFIKHRVLKLEKCLILYGKGANGKSVFFDVINALLGTENVSSFSLQSITNDSGYHRASLGTKLVNYCSELSSHMDSAYFKQLVSGEPIEARLPYGSPFILDDYAKFIFNANELPRDVEQNEAFFRRFIIIKFDVTIPEEQRDPELAQKIIYDELPGIFNWVLSGLDRLLQQKRFTHSEAVDKEIRDYRINSDSVNLFLQDQMYEHSLNEEVSLHYFYVKYNQHSIESGYKPVSKRLFADRLRNLKYQIQRKNTGNYVSVQKINI